MGYWLDLSDFYYEGDQNLPTDIAVSQRPHITCTYDRGTGVWSYVLADTREWQKAKYATDVDLDVIRMINGDRENMGYTGIFECVAAAMMLVDIATYADNVANNCPFNEGYRTITGQTKANAIASLTGNSDFGAGVLGKIYATKEADYASIDAAANGPAILAINYVRP
jgi:hypothetical protein